MPRGGSPSAASTCPATCSFASEECAAILCDLAEMGWISIGTGGVSLTRGQARYRRAKGVVDLLAEMAGQSREESVQETVH